MTRKTNQGPPYDVVLFDCDSTLAAVEGIDRLADWAGVHAELEPLTRAAMDGALPLDAVYARRLELIRPDRQAVERLARDYCRALVPGAREVVAALTQRGKAVHVVSGGILQAVLPMAETLGIPPARVHAVALRFNGDGHYAGFDETSPLARSRGKAAVCRTVVEPGQRAVLVGDGITDLEAMESGVDFIGFGGVERRPAVERQAPAYVPAATLLAVLDLLV